MHFFTTGSQIKMAMQIEKWLSPYPAVWIGVVLLSLCFGLNTQPVRAVEVDTVLEAGAEKVAAAQQSQRRIDKTAEQTDDLLREFQLLNRQIEGLEVYNAQLEKQLIDQRRTMADIAQSIENAALIERQITPLSLSMLNALEQFVALDLPFKIEQRQISIQQVKENLGAARFNAAEKFRQVLELYDIEGEYGTTIEQFEGVHSVGGQERQVTFLRVGRIAFLYQTADESVTGVWNKANRQWQVVPSGEYRRAVADTIRMAKKQAPVDLITLPIAAPLPSNKEPSGQLTGESS